MKGKEGPGIKPLIVNSRQEKNPVLKYIRNVPYSFEAPILPDFILGDFTVGFFLSLTYHNLHPDYIYERVQALGPRYKLRLLLCLIDTVSPDQDLADLAKYCVFNNLTLVVAWSRMELARYIEAYKAFEKKPPDVLKPRVENDYLSVATGALTSIRGVNKTDVLTLLSTFKTMKRLSEAQEEEMAVCPGMGPNKIKSLTEAFNQPFRKQKPSMGRART
eukprot:Nk52_evm2s245 gene=Nk52_evmTU2s245